MAIVASLLRASRVALTAGQAHETRALEEVLECVQVPADEDAWGARGRYDWRPTRFTTRKGFATISPRRKSRRSFRVALESFDFDRGRKRDRVFGRLFQGMSPHLFTLQKRPRSIISACSQMGLIRFYKNGFVRTSFQTKPSSHAVEPAACLQTA